MAHEVRRPLRISKRGHIVCRRPIIYSVSSTDNRMHTDNRYILSVYIIGMHPNILSVYDIVPCVNSIAKDKEYKTIAIWRRNREVEKRHHLLGGEKTEREAVIQNMGCCRCALFLVVVHSTDKKKLGMANLKKA